MRWWDAANEPSPPFHRRLASCGWFFFVLAAPLLLSAGGCAVDSAIFLARGETGVAEIVSVRENPNPHAKIKTRHVVFAVIAPDGTRLTAPWKEARPAAVGQRVRVRYRRESPVRIQPDDWNSAWAAAEVLAWSGAALLLGGLGMIVTGAMIRRFAAALPG